MNKLKIKLATANYALHPRAFPIVASIFDDDVITVTVADDSDNFVIYGKLAVIKIEGVLLQDASDFEKQLGFFDVEDIKEAIAEAEENPLVEAIVLYVNSPGGVTNGIPSTFDAVNNASKPVYAFTDSCCASAAYWFACGAKNGFYATQDAIVGSIGVYSYITSEMSQDAANNLSPVLLKAGKFKAIGIAPLSPEEIGIVQAEIDEDYSNFVTCINTERSIADDDLQGLTYQGKAALDKGFIDDVYESLEEFCDFLNEE